VTLDISALDADDDRLDHWREYVAACCSPYESGLNQPEDPGDCYDPREDIHDDETMEQQARSAWASRDRR